MTRFLLLVSLLALALSGCASLQYAGNASYSVKPFRDEQGVQVCCAVDVHNGKEIANLEAHITKDGDKYSVDLTEQGVAAFQGQQIAAGATKEAIDAAAKAAVAAVLIPILPALAPAAGAALASPGIGAAALGGAAVIGGQKAGVLQ